MRENLLKLWDGQYKQGIKEENKKTEEIIQTIPKKVKEAADNQEKDVLIMKLDEFNNFSTLENHINENLYFVGKGEPYLNQEVLDKLPKDLRVKKYEITDVAKKVFDFLEKNHLRPEVIVKNFRMHFYGFNRDFYIGINIGKLQKITSTS